MAHSIDQIYLHFFNLARALLLQAFDQHVNEREHLQYELFVDTNVHFAQQYREVLDVSQVRIYIGTISRVIQKLPFLVYREIEIAIVT